MKTVLFIAITTFSFFSFAQEYFGDQKPTIILEFSYFKSNDLTFTFKKEEIGTKYVVTIGGKDSLQITHFFKPDEDTTDYDLPYCDSVLIKLFCPDCTEAHVSKLTSNKVRRWYKVDDSFYVSKRWSQKFTPSGKSPSVYTVPVMFVDRKSNPAIVSVYGKEYTKQEWKAVRKSGIKQWK